jgi:hypothetical protein
MCKSKYSDYSCVSNCYDYLCISKQCATQTVDSCVSSQCAEASVLKMPVFPANVQKQMF